MRKVIYNVMIMMSVSVWKSGIFINIMATVMCQKQTNIAFYNNNNLLASLQP